MSSIKLLGETSGEVVLKAPAVAGASEVTLPTGTVDLANYVTADGSATFTNKSGNISQWTNDSGYMTATYTGNVDITGTLSCDTTLNVENSGGHAVIELGGSSGGIVDFKAPFSDDYDTRLIRDANNFTIGANDNTTNVYLAWTAGNKFVLEPDGDFHADGDVIAFSTTVSDIALKSDIEMIPNALDKIDDVRGVTFTRHNGQKSAGIIAQELEKVLPEAVREKELALLDGKKYKTVEYDAIHGLLINCIKELKEEIKELKNAVTK